jgi:hypothetical protein
VAASAAPYGYTLTVWTSGAVLSHARGIPSAADALLFLAGAVVAYALVGGLALGGVPKRLAPEPAHAVIWGGLHLFSVGLAIGAATLDAHLVTSPAAWPLGASSPPRSTSSPPQVSWPSPIRPAVVTGTMTTMDTTAPGKPGHQAAGLISLPKRRSGDNP